MYGTGSDKYEHIRGTSIRFAIENLLFCPGGFPNQGSLYKLLQGT